MSAINTIRRLAILNRGEAAMRCIRSVKALRALEQSNLESIAIYTDVDRDAPFVRHADHAVRLEAPNGPVAAYLDHDRLIALLVRAGADAVWPGWGFVSEDPSFADRVTSQGMRFLGPTGDVMRALGDKIDAKRIAEEAGIPVVPWSRGVVEDEESAARCAAELGYPVVVKAAAGGGGRGIRMVESESELADAFRSASAEAKSAFGDDRLFIERKLPRGRHIEVQIAVDSKGSAMSLGCRDCSVQRKHQKVIEEAPPPKISQDLSADLERAAVRLVEHVGYVGVGTVEFLSSGEEYSFLEVNPRLQVEHGITEELTGIDLVQLQIRIGRGEALPRGRKVGARVAIEARVCAEDPQADFLPTPGRIALFDPALGPRVRLDSGVSAGCRVPAEFDSLIAKLIATGETREEARARLACALTDFELVVAGGATNKGYLLDILETPEFRSGDFDTEWLDRTPELRAGSDDYVVEALVAAAILSYQRSRDAARQKFYADPATLSPASIPPSTGQRVDLTAGAESYRLEVFAVGAWRYRVHLDGRVAVATLSDERDNSAILELGGRSLRVLHDVSERGMRIEIEAHPYRFTSELAGQVRSGSPAVVIGIQVVVGDRVEVGQSLGLLEAMKSEIDFRAPVSGIVKEVCIRMGQQVSSGELLLIIEAEARGAFDVSYRQRLTLPPDSDPLDLFFSKGEGDEDEVPDLQAVERAGAADRRAAIEASRGEIRRILMGYDVNPARGKRLVALLEGPMPEDLSAELCSELAEIRHELAIFADIELLFVRAPQASVSGDVGPSNHARLRAYMRRMATEGAGMPDAFLAILRRALTHYGIENLEASDSLERAVLRMVASQRSPDLRRRLVLEILKRVHALAESGVNLGDDEQLEAALACISSMRGLLPDALADRAIEASYTIFEGPELERQAEQTTQEVENWLAAAESVPSQPPRAVLVHLANAPYNVFDRVGRWLSDSNPLRRSIAVAAHICRFYAPNNPPTHTSTIIGLTHIERLDLQDGRTLLGGVAAPDQILQALEQLARASDELDTDERIHSIELLVPVDDGEDIEGLRNAIAPVLSEAIKADRLTLTRLADSQRSEHFCFEQTAQGWVEMKGLYGLHPETADRIDLHRLGAFDCERLDSPDDIYSFHLRSREIPGDERIFVLADFRGRSPEHGHEATLHLASFERVFFDATRTLRNHLGLRDPSRRLQWNRIAVFTSPAIFLDDQVAARLARRLAPGTRHLGLEKVIARLNVLDRDHPEKAANPLEV
ncbi:MAG: ATP-grasp domain-containing protein, partial [Deltaproteobacteria bacterium]|nr:ATP-grasp domain-containing protein [Deltaproteobacteria bacterium]